MRLSKSEVQKILDSLSAHLKETSFKVYLFGSRIDNEKRGGDIDLLLLISPNDFEKIYNIKSSLKFDLEEVMGDQRVDLTLATERSLKNDQFLASIANEMVLLS